MLLAGCTSYNVSIRTFPVARADIYVDGARVGQTTDEGRANITTGTRSIFSQPLLEVRQGEQHAQLKMAYGQAGVRIEHVIRATSKKVGNDRYYDVVVSLVGNPLPPLKKELLSGRNELRVSNPNNFAVWVAVSSEGRGVDFIVFENDSETVNLPDGRYDISFVCGPRPDKLLQGESVSLSDHSVELRTIKLVVGD
jgi:hypothetical protein